MELDNNEIIQDEIIEQLHKNNPRAIYGEYNFSGLTYDKPSALIKYLHHHIDETKKVSFKDSDMHENVLLRLAYEMSERNIIIKELDLSNVKAIDDELIEKISGLLL